MIALVIGLITGLLSGLLGVGGGFVLTPALHIILGLPYSTAVGSSLVAIPALSVTGLINHWRLGHVRPTLAGVIGLFMVPGALVGNLVLDYLKSRTGDWLNPLLGIGFTLLLILALILVTIEYRRWRQAKALPSELGDWPIVYRLWNPAGDGTTVILGRLGPASLVIGFLTGLLGVGGGFILVPVLTAWFRLPARLGIGTSLLVVGGVAALTGAWHALREVPDWTLIGLLVGGGLVGSWLGAGLAKRLRGAKIRLLYLAVLVLVIIAVFSQIPGEIAAVK